MVILESRKLIYVHIHKTGGETVEYALTHVQQPNDLFLDIEHPIAGQGFERFSKLDKHSTALEIANVLGMDAWDTYFSWATVRNPYARMASLYCYMAAISEVELSLIDFPQDAAPEVQRRWVESADYPERDQWAFAGVRAYLATRGSRTPFSDFLRYPLMATQEPAYLSQFSRLRDADDALLITRAIKLESLSGLWPELCREMGLPRLQLVTMNATPARWKRTVAELFYRSADVELINTIHSDDFRWFDYEMMGRDPVPRTYPGAALADRPQTDTVARSGEEQEAAADFVEEEATLHPTYREHFAELALAPFRAVFPGKDLKLVGSTRAMYEETTDLDFIRQKLPHLKILHILRNPIDCIAASLTRRNRARLDRWHIQRVLEDALEWTTAWHQLVARSRTESDNLLILKYEDFAADFAGTTERMANFLGIEPLFKDISLPVPNELHRRALTADDLAFLEMMFADLDANWSAMDPPALLSRFPIIPLPYTPGTELDFSTGGSGVPYLLAGFNSPEAWGVWSEGPRARLAFRLREPTALRLELRFRLYAPEDRESAGFVLTVNGRPTSRFEPRRATWGQAFEHFVEISPAMVSNHILDLELVIINACPPEKLTASDRRLIGVGIEQMWIVPLETAEPGTKGRAQREGPMPKLALTPREAEAATSEIRMDALAQAAGRRHRRSAN